MAQLVCHHPTYFPSALAFWVVVEFGTYIGSDIVPSTSATCIYPSVLGRSTELCHGATYFRFARGGY